jgi:Undecaprenyl-phosphate glucose phosphotransferase
MRAATPQADPDLRRSATLTEQGGARRAPASASFVGAEPAGVRPLRPGRHDGQFTGTPANDDFRTRPRPWPPLLLGACVLALDVAILLSAGLGAAWITDAAGMAPIRVTLLVTALTIAAGFATEAYEHPILFSGRRQARRIGAAAAAAVAVTLAAAAAFGALQRLDPAWLCTAAILGGVGLTAGRAASAAVMRMLPRAARRAVIIGIGPQAARLARELGSDRAGLELIGIFDDRGSRAAHPLPGLPLLGGLPQLGTMIRRGEVEVVAIALPWSAEARVAALIEYLSSYPVELRLAPDLMAARLPGDRRPPIPPLLMAPPISGVGALLKAISDYLLATAALAVAALPMLLIALAVKLDSPGPVLFRQRRTGFNDRPFDVFKFRTMYADAADHLALRQVQAGDERVTRVGRILRRTSLDELPQLFNVLRGDMSFVGPRPHAPDTRAGQRRFDEVVKNYASRHRVKPGLTGLAQVRGLRGPTPTERQILLRVESDLEYIAHWSLWLDFLIILRTLLVVVRMRNAM